MHQPPVLSAEVRTAIRTSGIAPEAIIEEPALLEDYSRDSSELHYLPELVSQEESGIPEELGSPEQIEEPDEPEKSIKEKKPKKPKKPK